MIARGITDALLAIIFVIVVFSVLLAAVGIGVSIAHLVVAL